MKPSKLFIGVGNVLQRDDGVGVRAAELMAGLPLPPDIEVLDAGTAGMGAASMLEDRQLVVIADAVDRGGQPGEVFRVGPEQLRPYVESTVSLHDLHLLHALDEMRLLNKAPEKVVVLAVQVRDWSVGLGLSPQVEAALVPVMRLAAKELNLPPETLKHLDRQATAWKENT